MKKIEKPIFCRIGSKYRILKDILPLIPVHKTYIEAFAGSLSVFFNESSVDENQSVINDLDKVLINDYKMIKSLTKKEIEELMNIPKNSLNSKSKIISFYKTAPNTKINKIIKSIIRRCSTYGSKDIAENKFNIEKASKYPNPYNKIQNIKFYSDRLKNSKLYSSSYDSVIKKYDSSDTFVYLDPPYEESGGLYSYSDMDFDYFTSLLKSLKSKWLLSINDSPYIRKLFKHPNINIIPIIVQNPSNNEIKEKNRKELLIMNY